MKRVQAQSHTHFLPILKRMLLGRSSNPQVHEVILLLAESLIFTYYIASSYKPVSQLEFGSYPNYILAAMIVVLLIRYLVNATICRLVFLPALFCVFTGEFDEIMKAFILILLFVNCLIDIFANIQYQFMTKNPYSQSLNQTKFLHYLTLVIGTLIRTNQDKYFPSQTYIGEIILLVLFLVLIVLKLQSTCQNEWNKQIHVRFYMICLCYYLRNVIIVWQNSLGTNYQHLLVIAVSQIVYFLVAYKFNQLQVDIEISKNNICHLIFSLMSYQYSLVYDENKEKAILDLNPDRIAVSKTQMKKRLQDEELPVNSAINTEYEQLQGQKGMKNGFISEIMDVSYANRKTGMRAQQILRQAYDQKTDNEFRCLFLIAQIKLNVFNNMISSKKIIQRLNSQCSSVYWIDRICLYKFEQRLYDEIEKKYELNQVCQFEQFLSNQDFRTMLVKNSYEYLALWRYLSNVDFLFKKLSKLLNKVLKRKYEVNKFYNELKVKCSTTILLFIDYLYMVRRDVVNTLRICRTFEIYEESHHMLHVENKVYVSISCEQNVLVFQNVSYNVKKLLGYDRNLMKNAPISMLLPTFFVEAHQKLVNNEINLNNQGLYLMRKTVITKHFEGYYLLANIETKMIYSEDGSLIMQGYLQIKNDESYNWPNYFIVKQPEGQIIEIGAALKDVIQIVARKTAYITEYFDDKPTDQDLLEIAANEGNNQNKKYLYNNGIEYEYELIRTLTAPDLKLGYYVCKNNLIDMPSEAMVRESKNRMVESARQPTRFPKFSIKFEDFATNLQQYFQSKTELIKNMSLKSTMIVLIIAIVLILSALAMQIILISRVELIRQQNNVIQTDMSNLVEFYHALQNLGMIANQIAVESNLGVTYTYDYYNITELSLSIQKVNEKLSKFDKQLYGEVGDIAINYPKPFHDVLLDFTVNYFVRGYTGGDKQLNKIAEKDAHAFFKYIYGEGLDDYLDVFNEEVISFNNEDNRIKIGLGASIIVLMVFVFFMMVRIDFFQRNYEYETLDLLSTINATPIFANSITQFLRRAIGDINQKEFESDWNMEKTKKDQNTSFINKNQITSNISARENSVRNFFQDDLNSTNREQKNMIMNTLEQKQKVQRDENQRREQKIKPISKLFLLVWSILVMIVIGICITWIITDQKGNQIELPKSISSLLTILNKQILFSSQIITYIDMLTHQTSAQLYNLNVQKFNELNDLTYSFQQTKYEQFNNFTNLLQKVTYVYLCEYMKCSSNYKDYINIIYNSAIHKLNNYMTENKQQSVLIGKSYEMQALWYSHKLMENTINELLVTYLNCYSAFDNKRSSSYYLFYYCEISALAVCLAYVLYVYCWRFLGERKKYFRMLNLVKFESYDIKEPETL